MTTVPATKRKDEIKARVKYELDVIESAEYFTVVQFAPRGGTRKEEARSLLEAKSRAEEMMSGSTNRRDVMVYAVSRGHQALVRQLDHKGNWKEPSR